MAMAGQAVHAAILTQWRRSVTVAHKACWKKAVEGHRTPRREAFADDSRTAQSVLDCASPLALWPERGENGMVENSRLRETLACDPSPEIFPVARFILELLWCKILRKLGKARLVTL